MSYTFTVNGVQRTTDEKKSLLRYLRDDLRLTSVKDGCSQGACGACTVIIDGETVADYVVADPACGLYEDLRQIILAVENDYSWLLTK